MQFDVLREFACRGGANAVRMNAYVAHDPQRAAEDPAYRNGQRGFHDKLREQGFKVIVKSTKWYRDDKGEKVGKANADLDLAVDALLQSEKLDRVLLATGDGDFVKVVSALQNKGCRVEVVAFDNVSPELRREADLFFSGYLIPNLLGFPSTAVRARGKDWGEIGSRVRGTCYYYNQTKGFGFLRFMNRIGPMLWDVDSRKPDSPYSAAFFHRTDLPDEIDPAILPSREIIFEFELKKSSKGDDEEGQAGFAVGDLKGLLTSPARG
jgi:hypothetical protein